MKVNYEELKKSILIEHNRLRSDPSSFVPLLEEQMKFFKNDTLYKPKEIAIQTSEGKAAYTEAIKFLKRQKPVKELTFDTRISLACQDHANDIGPRGLISHESSDSKSLVDRFERYFEWDGQCCENIDVGNKIAVNVVISLLVDDGILDRPHRMNMFNPDMKYFGIGCGEHKDFDVITVIDYVSGIRDLGKPYYDYKNLKYEYPPNVNANQNTIRKKGKNTQSMEKDKIKQNQFQIDDPDAPDTTIALNIVKTIKTFENKPRKITRKIYTLENGIKHIVEIEEF